MRGGGALTQTCAKVTRPCLQSWGVCVWRRRSTTSVGECGEFVVEVKLFADFERPGDRQGLYCDPIGYHGQRVSDTDCHLAFPGMPSSRTAFSCGMLRASCLFFMGRGIRGIAIKLHLHQPALAHNVGQITSNVLIPVKLGSLSRRLLRKLDQLVSALSLFLFCVNTQTPVSAGRKTGAMPLPVPRPRPAAAVV